MKYHISLKFLAIVLAAALLTVALASGAGICVLLEGGLYERTPGQLWQEELDSRCHSLAVELVHRYASRVLGQLPENYLNTYSSYYNLSQFQEGKYFYTIRGESGTLLETTLAGKVAGADIYETGVTNVHYRKFVSSHIVAEGYVDYYSYTIDPAEDSAMGYAAGPTDTTYTDIYFDGDTESTLAITYTMEKVDYCTVTLYLLDGAVEKEDYWEHLGTLYLLRYDLFWVLGVSLLLFAACAVYLCCAAGRKPRREGIRAGGLNRLPLDLYFCAGAVAEWVIVMLFCTAVDMLAQDFQMEAILLSCAMLTLAAALVAIGFCFAFVAQIKMGERFWWRNSLLGRFLHLLRRGLGWCVRGCKTLLATVPAAWQMVVVTFVMAFVMLVTFLLSGYYRIRSAFFALLLFLEGCAAVALLCYCFYAFAVLKNGAANMARGDLHRLVPTARLVGPFREFAWQLNRLSGAARRAAEEQMKSERMKTELITNVSHDIKTPLTSIINYVDLLEKPHTSEEGQQYLGVLSRQSQRLKKLIEDLMEMSKASSGTIAVELTRLDAGESLRQALGEFSDKLEKAELNVVTTMPEHPTYVLADGRHMWRVLSNLLGNVAKYAMPGTRVYVDLIAAEESVIIAVKNISREELNISADELTERFVRGDASRNTEGSGLGLNIARSLMELQKGSLEVSVDGDLFKATLVFPRVK